MCVGRVVEDSLKPQPISCPLNGPQGSSKGYKLRVSYTASPSKWTSLSSSSITFPIIISSSSHTASALSRLSPYHKSSSRCSSQSGNAFSLPPPPKPLLPRLYWCVCANCRGYKPLEYCTDKDTPISSTKATHQALDIDFATESDEEERDAQELRNNNAITQLALKNPCQCHTSSSNPRLKTLDTSILASNCDKQSQTNTSILADSSVSTNLTSFPYNSSMSLSTTTSPRPSLPISFPSTLSSSSTAASSGSSFPSSLVPSSSCFATTGLRPSHIMNPAQLERERKQMELMHTTPQAKRKNDAISNGVEEEVPSCLPHGATLHNNTGVSVGVGVGMSMGTGMVEEELPSLLTEAHVGSMYPSSHTTTPIAAHAPIPATRPMSVPDYVHGQAVDGGHMLKRMHRSESALSPSPEPSLLTSTLSAIASSPCSRSFPHQYHQNTLHSPEHRPGQAFSTPSSSRAEDSDFVRYNNSTPNAQRLVQLTCPPNGLHSLVTSSAHTPHSISSNHPRIYTSNQYGRLTQITPTSSAPSNVSTLNNGQTPGRAPVASIPGPTIGQTSSITLTNHNLTHTRPLAGNGTLLPPSHAFTLTPGNNHGMGMSVGPGMSTGVTSVASHVPVHHSHIASYPPNNNSSHIMEGNRGSSQSTISEMDDSESALGNTISNVQNVGFSSLLSSHSGMNDNVTYNEPNLSRSDVTMSMPSHNMGVAALRSTRSVNFWGQ